jgi:hypothetical protein
MTPEKDLSKKITDIMFREMGHIGIFITKKQCKDLGIDAADIKEKDVPELAKALGFVMSSFGGKQKKEQIMKEILHLIN